MKNLVLDIKVYRENEFSYSYNISENFSADEEIEFCLAEIINRLIIDNHIKISNKKQTLNTDEQLNIIRKRQNQLFDGVKNLPINMEYVKSSETTNAIFRQTQNFCKNDNI